MLRNISIVPRLVGIVVGGGIVMTALTLGLVYYQMSQTLGTAEERELAKGYLKKAFMGWLKITLDEKVDQWFEKLERVTFAGEDEFHLELVMTTKGNDVLAAMGVAQDSYVEWERNS